MIAKQLVVIGGGSAGLCAAIEGRKNGIEDILILERNPYLGGILRQCIHNGFGVHRYQEDLTGVEFADRITGEAQTLGIPCMLETHVLDITPDKVITAMNPEQGILHIRAESIVLAMGCRERSRGALMIPGARCAGVMTAGTAQYYMNIKGYLPGKKAVILGSGDIGLIMARQLTLEGVKVERVVEIMPCSSGLARNISQCLEDFDIPISYNSTVTKIHGKSRVERVTVAQVDASRRAIPGTEVEIDCDMLMISAGLIPENELTRGMGIELAERTKGAIVDQTLMTEVPGVFACGNVLHVHDLVDHVSEEGSHAGRNAALWLQGRHASADMIPVSDGRGANGVVPQRVVGNGTGSVSFSFRPAEKCGACTIVLEAGKKTVKTWKRSYLTPGEMCVVSADASVWAGAKQLSIRIRKAEEQ